MFPKSLLISEIFFINLIIINTKNLCMNRKEIAIIHIASSISIFSMRQNDNTLPENVSMIDFILKTAPKKIKPDITIDLIDNVFSYVSTKHQDT